MVAQGHAVRRQLPIDHIAVFPYRSPRWERLFPEGMPAQEFVELPDTFLVPGDARIEVAVPMAEFQAKDGLDPVWLTGPGKLEKAGGVVDVAEYQGFDPSHMGFPRQILRVQRTVAQGEITVTV